MAQAEEARESRDFFAGVPIAVEPEQIERELARLWKPQDGDRTAAPPAAGGAPAAAPAATRACLSNLIVYLPEREACERTSLLLLEIGRRIPSRILLLTHCPGTGAPGGAEFAAWVTAVCQVPAHGVPAVCCEQITLEARSGLVEQFPGAILPLLVPDVPALLFLPGGRGEELIGGLGTILDHVVFDSRLHPPSRLQPLLPVLESPGIPRVDDLAWRDTVGWRRVLRDIFDDPAARPILDSLEHIEVAFQRGSEGGAPGGDCGARAALLAGWLASRLGWRPVPRAAVRSSEPGRWVNEMAGPGVNRRGRITLRSAGRTGAAPGSLLSLRLTAGQGPEASFLAVEEATKGDLLRIEYHTPQACVIPRTVPCRRSTEAELLGGALERVTHQQVLREALMVAACLG